MTSSAYSFASKSEFIRISDLSSVKMELRDTALSSSEGPRESKNCSSESLSSFLMISFFFLDGLDFASASVTKEVFLDGLVSTTASVTKEALLGSFVFLSS